MNESRKNFIINFWLKCNEICPKYGLNAIDAIVAQACCESRYGESGLSKYHNYFGMKCGSSYKGKSVNMATKEEYQPGVISNIRDNFRAYDSMEEGIKGYCEFITGFSRYSNLKGVTDSHQYFVNLKNDGWATASSYVATLDSIDPIVKDVMKRFFDWLNTQNVQTTNPTPQNNYVVGKTYTLRTNVNVRTEPSIIASKVGHNGLTADGKKHDRDKNGSLDRGTVITCKEVKKVGNDIWLRCPSGWLCAISGGEVLIN